MTPPESRLADHPRRARVPAGGRTDAEDHRPVGRRRLSRSAVAKGFELTGSAVAPPIDRPPVDDLAVDDLAIDDLLTHDLLTHEFPTDELPTDELVAARVRTEDPKTVRATSAGGPRVLVVGAGPLFLSGITYYTHRVATALARDHPVSVVLMRRLLPRRFYPGQSRVGSRLAELRWPAGVPVLDGVDWYWGASFVRAARFLQEQRPEILVLQWWTGTVLHSYLALAMLARRHGARVVLEMHETQDVGEMAAVPGAARYVSTLFPQLLRRCSALVVHSEFDRALVEDRFGQHHLPVKVIPHAPYGPLAPDRAAAVGAGPAAESKRPSGPTRLLYFGIIRPFKGVEDLLTAFASLSPAEAEGYRLTVVGETWEGWTLPAELIAAHPHRDRITFINRYVTDAEAADLFADTDALVLPYHRSSSSGPLSMAIGHGLPVLVTRVGGLVEAARDYAGAVFIPPKDPTALAAALPSLVALVGRHHESPSTWDETARRYDALFAELPRALVELH